MQSQQRRDEKTLQIFAALLMLVGVLGAGWLVLLVANVALGLADDLASKLMLVVSAAASYLAITYLIRQNKRP